MKGEWGDVINRYANKMTHMLLRIRFICISFLSLGGLQSCLDTLGASVPRNSLLNFNCQCFPFPLDIIKWWQDVFGLLRYLLHTVVHLILFSCSTLWGSYKCLTMPASTMCFDWLFDDGVGPFFGPCNMSIWLIFCAPLSIQSANSPRLQKCIILFGGNSW
jgi:hypothetical protein